MGFFSEDLESMVELYQRETAELMEEFDSRLTGAVQENHFSEQDISAIFRAAHTIKSSAAMMGLADISTCTHRMEDLFLLFRDKPERTHGNENRIFDLMYLFSDYLEKENARVSQEDFRPESAAPVIDAIRKEIDFFSAGADESESQMPASGPGMSVPEAGTEVPGGTETVLSAADAASGNPGPASVSKEIIWNVKLKPNCQMENVRAFMLVRQIREFCGKVETVPANLEAPGAGEQIARDGLRLVLRTARADEAMKKLMSSPYVAAVEKPADAPGRDETQPNRQNKFSMVSWSDVMHLQNITGELITANTILGASLKSLEKDTAVSNEIQSMNRLFRELEKLVAAVSMTPVSSVVPQYYRLVRDVALKEGKQIRLKVVGEELEADRNLLDTLSKPLVHLLRNAADHGIELPAERTAAGKDPCGIITLKFENLTDHLRVSVADDGAGMDTKRILKKAEEQGILTKSEDQYTEEEILNMAFLPGLTTNEQANQYSGRGVGMDVAQSVAGALGGSVTVSSSSGKGSEVMMEVPVSMTSAECIRFQVGSHVCLIPIRCVVRVFSLEEAEGLLQMADGHRWFRTGEKIVPVLDMFSLFREEEEESRRLIVIRDARTSIALLTGKVTGQQTAVEKPLPSMLGRIYRSRTGIIGCTVTETGKLGFMLNADWLIRMCEKGVAEDGNEQQR